MNASRMMILAGVTTLLVAAMAFLRQSDSEIEKASAEVREFAWSWYEPNIVPWKNEKIETDLAGVHQPQIHMGPDEELVVQARERLYHSLDGGRTWKTLCSTPPGNTSGVAILRDGTFLLATNVQHGYEKHPYRSERYTIRSFTYRSKDRGKTWSPAFELDPWPYDGVGTDASIRFHEHEDGTIYYPVSTTRIARPGKPLTKPNWYFAAQLYVSLDGGRTFRSRANMGKWTCEADLLSLDDDELLASIRYQTPGEGLWPRYKQTAISRSTDGGRTWTIPRIVTGFLQQTGCLVQLSDGTIVLPFSHKDEGFGQRFLVSYDRGHTWSKTIFELNRGGMFASSVTLSDDTIVTVFEDRSRDRKLTILRWKIPSREEVKSGGFFTPPPVDLDRMYSIHYAH